MKNRKPNQLQHSHKPKPNPEEGPNFFSSVKAERSDKAAEEKFEASIGWFMKCFFSFINLFILIGG